MRFLLRLCGSIGFRIDFLREKNYFPPEEKKALLATMLLPPQRLEAAGVNLLTLI